jgi:hypothetical protein
MVGHQAVCDHGDAVSLMVALDQAQTVFVVARVEEYPLFSRTPVVDVVVVILGKHVASIWHLIAPVFGLGPQPSRRF